MTTKHSNLIIIKKKSVGPNKTYAFVEVRPKFLRGQCRYEKPISQLEIEKLSVTKWP